MWAYGVMAAMAATEFTEVSISSISKAAMSRGMSIFVYTVYSNALAIFILLLKSLIFYRKRNCLPLTVSMTFRIFLLAIASCCVQFSLNIGIRHSSPTLCAAMTDLVPALTFMLAIISRMEKLDLSAKSSQAKSVGTVLSIAGAWILTLYKGPQIIHSSPQSQNASADVLLSLPSNWNWIVGGIFCAAGALCLSVLYIIQTWIIKDYPEELIVTLIACIFATALSAVVSLVLEKDPNTWKLKPDIELLAIVLLAIFGVSIRSLVHTWACRLKGPLYTSMFKPLGMVIAVILGVSFLGDGLYTGSVIGGIIIACGFYAVIWGKTKEEQMFQVEQNSKIDSASPNCPLLQSKILVLESGANSA
ncbi:hypothetical protein K2173_003190 [Erythroxylum novogranatense]|uniref:WAT1-related protein n=1 Tax=Erythroxylum novogranatense TaxID=1862640 RepID=A0AAV8SWW2_9ROSI|nr:hypothetical protein K2173_003190 [Erythroxylum novogranatense]